MMEGPAAPTGFEYYRHDGETASGEPFRIRHFLDPDGRKRFVVALVGGRLFSSRSEDLGRGMETARTVYGAVEGKSETDVARQFGAPKATTRFEDIRVLWYERDVDDVFVLVFRQGRCVAAFRTDRGEIERLEKPSPYARMRPRYGLSPPVGTNLNDVTAARYPVTPLVTGTFATNGALAPAGSRPATNVMPRATTLPPGPIASTVTDTFKASARVSFSTVPVTSACVAVVRASSCATRNPDCAAATAAQQASSTRTAPTRRTGFASTREESSGRWSTSRQSRQACLTASRTATLLD